MIILLEEGPMGLKSTSFMPSIVLINILEPSEEPFQAERCPEPSRTAPHIVRKRSTKKTRVAIITDAANFAGVRLVRVDMG